MDDDYRNSALAHPAEAARLAPFPAGHTQASVAIPRLGNLLGLGLGTDLGRRCPRTGGDQRRCAKRKERHGEGKCERAHRSILSCLEPTATTPYTIIGCSRRGEPLRTYRRALHRHAARAPHEEELERHVFRRAVLVGLRAHADQAVAQPPLQRAEVLPFQPVERIAGRVALRDHVADESLAPLVVVALRTGEVELALARAEQRTAFLEERLQPLVGGRRDRHTARLARHIGREREQVLALVAQRRRLLLLAPADHDALLEIDWMRAR